jgi:hypothetical protein
LFGRLSHCLPIAGLIPACEVGADKPLEKTDGVPIAAGGIAQTLAGRRALRGESLEHVRKAMTKAGITFLPDDGKAGVGVRGRISG